jgi:hypothetical protein
VPAIPVWVVGTVPPAGETAAETVYDVAPVAPVQPTVMVVRPYALVVGAVTASGNVNTAAVVTEPPAPLALIDWIVNVYDVPAVRPVNVAATVGAVIVWVARPAHDT